MDLLVILGYVLIVLGVVFVIFALLDLAGRLPARKATGAGASAGDDGFLDKMVALVEAIGAVIEQLIRAPRWLSLFLLGLILLVGGIWLVLGHPGIGSAQQARMLVSMATAT